MEITPTTTYTCVAGNTIDPAGNVPKVWGDDRLFDYRTWQSYNVVYGENIIEQNWGSGALTMAANGSGVQIIVDPSTAEVEYRSFDGTSEVADGGSSPRDERGMRPGIQGLNSDAMGTGSVTRVVDCAGRRVSAGVAANAGDRRGLSTGVYFVESASRTTTRFLIAR